MNSIENLAHIWCDHLEKILLAEFPESKTKFIVLKNGTKFWKIISKDRHSESVHAFLEVNTGNIFKPAGWKGPAKHIRFNIFEKNFLNNVTDPYGGYLYLK